MPPKYPYIENFCDDSVYVFSTIGQGPKGDKGDRGDAILPIFSEPIEWDQNRDYEDLSVVMYQGDSYTSKKAVPAGVDIRNTNYWARTANFNAQLQTCRDEIAQAQGDIASTRSELRNLSADKVRYSSAKMVDQAILDLEKDRFVKMISMPHPYRETGYSAGDCTVFVEPASGSVIMFDSGTPGAYQMIKSELDDNGISHVDFFILSHYHGDHFGNCQNMIDDGLIDSSTVCYLPKSAGVEVDDWGDEARARDELSICECITPSNETTLDVEGIEISFMNCGDDDIAYYDSQATPHCNNYSICNYVKIGNTRILMTGDILKLAEQRLYDSGKISQCDIMKVPHHMHETDVSQDFYFAANPTYAIAHQNIWASQVFTAANSGAAFYLGALGCNAYVTGEDAIYAGIGRDSYSVFPNGNEIRSSWSDKPMTINVDSEYDGTRCDGSSKHPFKTLQAAISFASKLPVFQVAIRFLSAYESEEDIKVDCALPKINIPACTVHRVIVRNCYVDLNGVTVTSDANNAVYYMGGRGYLANVVAEGNVRSAASVDDGCGIYAYSSNIEASSCTISNKRCCVKAGRDSVVCVMNLKGVNNEYILSQFESTVCHVEMNSAFEADNMRPSRASGFLSGRISNDPYRDIGTLKNGNNLNDFVETGKLYSPSGTVTQSLVNGPTGARYSGELFVHRFSASLITQTFVTTNYSANYVAGASDRGTWVRSYGSNGWEPWVKQI